MITGTVEIEFDGQKYSGTYRIKGRKGRETMTVDSVFDTTTTPLGGMRPEALATLILREQVRWALKNAIKP